MYTRQITIFVENRKGRFAEVTRLLAEEGINIRALSLGDMVDYGVLRLIVDNRQRCLDVLKAHDFTVQETPVVAVEMDDRPGGLHRIIDTLDREGISIEYMYTFFKKNSSNAFVVFKFGDSDKAIRALDKNGISVLPDDLIQNL